VSFNNSNIRPIWYSSVVGGGTLPLSGGSPAKRNATPLRRGAAPPTATPPEQFSIYRESANVRAAAQGDKATVAASWGRGRGAAHITLRSPSLLGALTSD